MGTATKHPLGRVKPSFVIFDIRTLWRSGLSITVPGCQKLQMTATATRTGTGCTHRPMAPIWCQKVKGSKLE